MLTKLVKKGGHNWDTLLGPVLFAYRTTPHSSTQLTPFYLLYGREPELSSSLNFQIPMVRYPVVETEFAKELVKELKQARTLAQKNIQSKQKEQKRYYDRRAKIRELKVGDLVMLKTAPRFRLDRSFKGPFVVKTVTPTNAVIQLKVMIMQNSSTYQGRGYPSVTRRWNILPLGLDTQTSCEDVDKFELRRQHSNRLLVWSRSRDRRQNPQ